MLRLRRGRETEQLLGGAIAEQYALLVIDGDQPVGHARENGLKLRLVVCGLSKTSRQRFRQRLDRLVQYLITVLDLRSGRSAEGLDDLARLRASIVVRDDCHCS